MLTNRRTSLAEIKDLVSDIQNLFTTGHICSDENVRDLGKSIAEVVSARLAEAANAREPFRLRMSNIGKHPKQLWYEKYHPENIQPLEPSARIKFLFGDILERMLIFLAKEAGHDVSEEQSRVELEGIQGSMDCVIDGHVVDCKSASTFSYKKFSSGELRRDDSFGYLWQISGYNTAYGSDNVPAFLVIDKTLGHICLMEVPKEELALYDVTSRIRNLKVALDNPNPPEGCCGGDEPLGKAGNRVLTVKSSYCNCKQDCWKGCNDGKGLQKYFYSNGIKYFTKVVKEPKVDKEEAA